MCLNKSKHCLNLYKKLDEPNLLLPANGCLMNSASQCKVFELQFLNLADFKKAFNRLRWFGPFLVRLISALSSNFRWRICRHWFKAHTLKSMVISDEGQALFAAIEVQKLNPNFEVQTRKREVPTWVKSLADEPRKQEAQKELGISRLNNRWKCFENNFEVRTC